MKNPFEVEIDRLAERQARTFLKTRPDLMLSHSDALAATLGMARTIRDEWAKLAALRMTYHKPASVRRVEAAQAKKETAPHGAPFQH